MTRTIFFVFIHTLCFFCLVSAQSKYSISGIIYDSKNGETLIGATVSINEINGTGTVSNAYGYYSITLPEGNYTMSISYTGYQQTNKSIILNKSQHINIQLLPKNKLLNEVVVSAGKKNNNITSTENFDWFKNKLRD